MDLSSISLQSADIAQLQAESAANNQAIATPEAAPVAHDDTVHLSEQTVDFASQTLFQVNLANLKESNESQQNSLDVFA